jgi:hypothetical protein
MNADMLAAIYDTAQVFWTDDFGLETPFFSGRVTRAPLAGSAAEEDQTYEISDAWADFERVTFQQQWNRIRGVDESGNPTTAFEYSACCLLGIDINGNAQTSGQVIIEAVTWAIARGALCQIGAIGVASPVPVDEVTDVPCAEVIKRMLRFTPDAVAEFDHSTSPPTFNIRRRSGCVPVTLPFVETGDHVDIKPRNDLLRPEVLLRYEQPNVSDGVTYTSVYIDEAPSGADGLAYGALVSTVRLAGSNATYQKQPIQTKPIPQSSSDPNVSNWWYEHIPWLKDYSPDRIQVVSGTHAGSVDPSQYRENGDPVDDDIADYPHELISGTIAEWMQSAYPTLQAARVTYTAHLSYIYPDISDTESTKALTRFGPDGGPTGLGNDVEVLVTITGTNAVNKIYAILSSYDEAEPAPVGLAGQLYSALSVLEYEGSWNIVQEEPAPSTRLGIVLNLTGGRPEWVTMNALVQQITDDLDKGTTTFKFGPAGHLTIQDLMEQLRATRERTISSKIKERKTGEPGGAPVVNGAGQGPLRDSATPTVPGGYPWIDYIDDQDNSDGSPATYEALLGYGKSSFADTDAIDHAGPLECFEISVGNDGSGWDGPLHSAGDLTNGLSLISGDSDAGRDVIYIATSGGSVKISPDAAAIYLGQGFDSSDSSDQFINIDRNNLRIEIQDSDESHIELDLSDSPLVELYDGDSYSYVKLNLGDSPTVEIYDGGDSSTADLEAAKLTFTDGSSGATIYLDASAPSASFADSSGENSATLSNETLAISTSEGTATLAAGSLDLNDEGSGGAINLDASATGGRTMYPQEVELCGDSGTMHAMMLMTDPY